MERDCSRLCSILYFCLKPVLDCFSAHEPTPSFSLIHARVKVTHVNGFAMYRLPGSSGRRVPRNTPVVRSTVYPLCMKWISYGVVKPSRCRCPASAFPGEKFHTLSGLIVRAPREWKPGPTVSLGMFGAVVMTYSLESYHVTPYVASTASIK
jgi:hypothetical protein